MTAAVGATTARVLARVAAVVAIVAVATARGAVAGQSPSDEASAVLARFEPLVRVRHQEEACGDGERFLPVAVDAILGRDDVVLRDGDDEIVARAPGVADLAGGGADLWIDLPGDTLDPGCSYEQWFDALGAEPTVYGRLTSQDGELVAQYWYFWVYNQWNDLHEGDWEMVQLVFDTSLVSTALRDGPATYAYAQHEGSQFVEAGGDVTIVDGTRPVVYPGQGSHASYFRSSRWFGKSGATGFGCDDTSGPVDQIDPALVVLPGDDVATTGPFAWLSYQGHWGERAPSFNNGPTGPVTKTQWSAPVTWVDDEGRDSAVALPFAGSRATEAFCNLSTKGSMLFIRLLRQPIIAGVLLAIVVAAIVVVVRRSSRGVLGQAARLWRARAGRLLPIGSLVAVGAAGAWLLQQALLRWTALGTLVDEIGASSAWVAPLLGLVGSLVAVPVFALVGAATIRAVRADDPRPVATVASRRRPAFWTSLALLAVTEVALVFPPLLVLSSRWLAAPVDAVDSPVTARHALVASNRRVRGHGWRSLGMMVTLLLIAAVAGVVGALVLVFTPLTFTGAGAITALVGVVLVPYLATILAVFHDELSAPSTTTPDRGEGPTVSDPEEVIPC